MLVTFSSFKYEENFNAKVSLSKQKYICKTLLSGNFKSKWQLTIAHSSLITSQGHLNDFNTFQAVWYLEN